MTDRLIAEALTDLDLDYVAEVGASLRAGLVSAAGAAETDYMPGDGTHYPISLVRLRRFVNVADRTYGPLPAWPGVDYETGVLVALGGGYGRCYAINLFARSSRIHYAYVAEHWGSPGKTPSVSDVAIAVLLDAVAGFPPERTT